MAQPSREAPQAAVAYVNSLPPQERAYACAYLDWQMGVAAQPPNMYRLSREVAERIEDAVASHCERRDRGPDQASRQLLALVGRALHGERWQSGLARSLGVSGRQVRRWVAGDAPLPADLRERLSAVLMAQLVAIARIAADTVMTETDA